MADVFVPVEFFFPLIITNTQLKKEQWAANRSIIKDRHVFKM